MKKIIVIIFIVALVSIGGFYYFQSGPANEQSSSHFIPANENADNYFLFGMKNLENKVRKISDGINYIAETFSEVNPQFRDRAIEIASTISLKLEEIAPKIDDIHLLLSINPNGFMLQPSIWGSLTLNDPQPRKLIDNLMENLAITNQDLVIIPLETDLGPKTQPLFQIMDTETGITLNTAVYEDDSSFFIFSTSRQELRNMISAAEDPSLRMDPDRYYDKNDFFRVRIDNNILKAVMQTQGRTLHSTDPLFLETVFYTEDSDFIVKTRTNTSKLMFTDSELKNTAAVSKVDSFYGGGKVIGFILGRFAGVEEEDFAQMLSGQVSTKAPAYLMDYLRENYDITLQDFVELFNGEINLVLGGNASSPIGDIPGLYISIKPFSKGISKKFASLVPSMEMPVAVKTLDVPGWDIAYSINPMITLTVAAREHELLAGILNTSQLAVKSDVSENIAPLMQKETYGTFALSVTDLAIIVDELAAKAQLMYPAPELDMLRKNLKLLSEKVKTITAMNLSVEESVLRVTFRE